jgi:hypothetical protein
VNFLKTLLTSISTAAFISLLPGLAHGSSTSCVQLRLGELKIINQPLNSGGSLRRPGFISLDRIQVFVKGIYIGTDVVETYIGHVSPLIEGKRFTGAYDTSADRASARVGSVISDKLSRICYEVSNSF